MSTQINNKIRKIRELKGYSQEYMADKLNISQRAYGKIESGETKLSWDHIYNISKVLEIEPVDLISFDDSLVFNNCTQSGKIQNQTNNYPKELKEQHESQTAHLEEEIIFLKKQLNSKEEQHQSQIKHLEGEIAFLREQLNKK